MLQDKTQVYSARLRELAEGPLRVVIVEMLGYRERPMR
jgi:hypothetical protein